MPDKAYAQSISDVIRQGMALEAQGQYEQALYGYTNVISRNPYNQQMWSLYIQRGFVFFNGGRLDDAFKDFQAAGQLNPNEALCYMARGMAYASVGDYDRALADMNTALAKSPNEARYYFQRGYMNSLLNNYPAALADLDKSASLRTTKYEQAFDHAARAVVYARNQEFDKVEPEVTRALDIFNSSSQAEKVEAAALLSELALARALKNDVNGCKQIIDQAYQITPMPNLTRSRLLAVSCLWAGMTGNSTQVQSLGTQACALVPKYKWVQAVCNAGATALQATSGGTMVATQNTGQNNYPVASGTTNNTTVTQTPSHTTTVVSNNPSASKADKPINDKWALVVGISKFQDPSISKLKYSAKDARDFADFLVSKCNFKRDHVRLLLDEQATQRRILEELGDKFLPRVADQDDLVVFYFSSHGSPAKRDSRPEYRPKNYLIAYDTNKSSLFASGINVNDLSQLIKERVPTERILIVLDACHSGAADANAKDGAQPGSINPEQIAGVGQMVICSSGGDERSWESKRYANGVFTKHLMEALVQKRKIKDAFAYMEDTVTREVKEDEAAKQTPVIKDQWTGADVSLLAEPFKPRQFPASVKQILQPDSFTSPPQMVPNKPR